MFSEGGFFGNFFSNGFLEMVETCINLSKLVFDWKFRKVFIVGRISKPQLAHLGGDLGTSGEVVFALHYCERW